MRRVTAAAVVAAALAFLLGRASAGDDRPVELRAGQRYEIRVPAGPVQATYLGPCPGRACLAPDGTPGSLAYHLFEVGDTRIAVYLAEWITPAD